MIHTGLVLALALATTTGAPADSPRAPSPGADSAKPAAPAAAEPSSDGAKRKKICTKERSMGSNMLKRVCRDAEASDVAGEQARDGMRDATLNRYSPPSRDK